MVFGVAAGGCLQVDGVADKREAEGVALFVEDVAKHSGGVNRKGDFVGMI